MIIYYILFPALFFIISVYLSRKDFLLVVAFIFILHVFLKIFIYKILPDVAFASGTFINISVVLIFIYYILTRALILHKQHIHLYMGSVLLLLLYLIMLASFREEVPTDYLYYVRNYFYNFLLIIIFFSLRNEKKIRIEYYIKFIIIILSIQVFLGFAQYISPVVSDFFKIKEYQRLGVYQLRISEIFHEAKVVVGTFGNMQGISSFILVNVIFLISLKFFKIKEFSFLLYILLCFVCIIMLLAGARAPVLGLLIGLGLILWFQNKLLTIGFAILFIIIIPILVQILLPVILEATYYAGGSKDLIENPLIRVVGGLAFFDSEIIQYTTFRRTIFLAENLTYNLITGTGGILFRYDSVTDAFFMLILIEFGLIGFFLIYYPYQYTLTQLKKCCSPSIYKAGIVLLITTLSQSVVNEGLWTMETNIQFFFMIMVLFRINEETLKAGDKNKQPS